MSSFNQIICDLKKEMEDYKKSHTAIYDSEEEFCERYLDYKILKAKLDQTLLCEKIANEQKSELIEKIKDKILNPNTISKNYIDIGEFNRVLDTFKQAEKIE